MRAASDRVVHAYLPSCVRVGHRCSQKRVARLPIPGGRYYIFPAAVGERVVPRGQIQLDRDAATAWVNDADWLEMIVPILGGCDGDDAVWVLPFTDVANGERQILVWRSPNQVGEYVLLQPTGASDEIEWKIGGDEGLTWPPLDSRRLPRRIDEVTYHYGELTVTAEGRSDAAYHVAAMSAVIERAAANVGTLGAFCNLTMVQKALYGELPTALPATMEAIIDGSVKQFADLTPVREWLLAEARAILERRTAVPRVLRRRLLTLLPRGERCEPCLSEDHWLDRLMDGLHQHQADYQARLEALVARCTPPIELFATVDEEMLALGNGLRQRYAAALRAGTDLDEARECCEAYLADHKAELGALLRGAAAACYVGGNTATSTSDGVLWQLGAALAGGGRQPSIAQAFIEALRETGLLGEPVWTTEGLQWHYSTEKPPTVGEVVTLNGVWFNLLCAQQPELAAEMSAIPADVRESAKDEVAQLARRRLAGMSLKLVAEGNERLVGYTPRGNCFGYVQRGHEVRLHEADTWRIQWATATDGNVHAVLQAVEM